MNRRDPIVIQAIWNVLGRQSLTDWVHSLGRDVVDEIYDEVRRLDRAAIGAHIAGPEASPDGSATTEALIDDDAPAPV